MSAILKIHIYPSYVLHITYIVYSRPAILRFINLTVLSSSSTIPKFMYPTYLFYGSAMLIGTLAWDFFVPVFCTDQTYIGQIIRLLSLFDFVLEFADLFKFSNFQWWLSWCQVSFPVNWVSTKWDSVLTVSMQSETPCQLSQRGMMKSS
jgi:hypothetical protein